MAKVNEICKGLFVSDYTTALDKEFFDKNNIKAVVNCTTNVKNKFEKSGVIYFNVELEDDLQPHSIKKMTKILPEAVGFVSKHYKPRVKCNVLIHCIEGKQRSLAVCLSWLIHTNRVESVKHGKSYILSKRPTGFHNGSYINFRTSITKFSKKLKLKK